MGQIPLLSAIKLGYGALALTALVLGILARCGRLPPVAGLAAALTALIATAGLTAWLTGTPLVAAIAAAVGAAGFLWWRRAPAMDRGRRAGVFVFGVLAAGGLVAWTNFGTF
ncbi:MAG TPA: hypothetical protein VM285_01550, partial [Polyangia bacterium]|nr:hypothetical protein [Polyangia bacterium]